MSSLDFCWKFCWRFQCKFEPNQLNKNSVIKLLSIMSTCYNCCLMANATEWDGGRWGTSQPYGTACNAVFSIRKKLPIGKKMFLPGWPTCSCSYGKFLSRLGGILAKSSEILPRRAGSLLIGTHLCFHKNFLRKVRSHLGKPACLTGPAHLHMSSP